MLHSKTLLTILSTLTSLFIGLTMVHANTETASTPTLHKINHQNISFNVVSFNTKNYELQLADQPNGPGTLWKNSATVAKKKEALAAINAGFFTPEGKPLGLLIDNEVQRGSYNTSSLGRGIYYTTKAGAKISRGKNGHYKNILLTKPKYLLQTGPMLVEKSISTIGLSTQNARPRSFIATNDTGQWIIGHASSCTLSQLGTALTTLKIPNLKISTALNLDGGRSSDLWVGPSITGGPLTIRPFWNSPVRNFLVLKKR